MKLTAEEKQKVVAEPFPRKFRATMSTSATLMAKPSSGALVLDTSKRAKHTYYHGHSIP